jgi:hypothetical protein
VIKIRRPAVLFALLSAFYWVGVTELWRTVTFLHYNYWSVLLASTFPPMLYALAALWFCGWLARQVIEQMTALKSAATPSNERHGE